MHHATRPITDADLEGWADYLHGGMLCQNGMVVHRDQPGGKFVIRHFDPNETMDSKWDVLMRDGGWGAAACLCFADHGAMTFDTLVAAMSYVADMPESLKTG